MNQKPDRILIIKPSAMGDVVLTLPALSSLRASFPDARIDWLIRPAFATLLQNDPRINERILFDRKSLGAWWYKPAVAAELRRFLAQLRNNRYDLVFDFQGLLRTGLFAWCTKSPRRVGMKNCREFAGLFYTRTVPIPDNSIHLVDCYQKMVTQAGAPIRRDEYGLSASPHDRETAQAILKENALEPKKFAVLIPGSNREYKNWPIENYARLAEKIQSEFGLQVAAVGSGKENEIIAKLIKESNVKIVDLCNRTSIGQLIAVLEQAALVVSNDTGPGHIAVAVGTPTVLCFGPTNPARVGPYQCPEGSAAVDPFTRGPQIENHAAPYSIQNLPLDTVLTHAKTVYEKYAEKSSPPSQGPFPRSGEGV